MSDDVKTKLLRASALADGIMHAKSKTEAMYMYNTAMALLISIYPPITPQYEDQQEEGWQNIEAKSVSHDGTDKETG